MAPKPSEALRDHTAGITNASVVDVSAADVTLSAVTRGLLVGVSGDVAVQFIDGPDVGVIIPALAAGVWHPMQIRGVLKTGTTATGIRAGY